VAGHCEHSNKLSGFHKITEISWLAEDLPASQERFCSMELVRTITANKILESNL
jgi:peroxiredoxin